ncbi:phage portal protein [Georgenia sp. MJ170]|uniref:phage portal protein n=1 Tax=Georgenia sunbinii TaxID=3117728 RepID=UPI002F263E14
MAYFQTLGELSSHLETTGNELGVVVPDAGIPLHDYATRAPDAWSSQPSVHKVTDFMARNLAAIPLHVFQRVSDTDRRRVTDGPLAELMRNPSTAPGESPFRFWYKVILDGLLHDRYAIMPKLEGGRWQLVRIPARKFSLSSDHFDRIVGVRLWSERDRRWVRTAPEQFLLDAGYASSGAGGTSPLKVLEDLLAEHSESVAYRRSVWANSMRGTGVVERGTAWPSKEARSRFMNQLRSATRGGPDEGGTMLLDDGMTWKDRRPLSPKDTLDLEGRRLTDVEVASAYHIAPELVGAREGTFANVKAYRQALYVDGLGSYIVQLEHVLRSLVELVEGPGSGMYIEAHVESKLRGAFEDQAQAIGSAVGAPYMTRNEGRALRNLPAIDGGDELLEPLNMIQGGQTIPGEAPPGRPPRETGGEASRTPGGRKSVDEDDELGYRDDAAAVFSRFFKRQRDAVLSRIGAGGEDWWEADRWDSELAADLYALAVKVAGKIGPDQARRLGFAPGDYDPERTQEFLSAVAESRAGLVNRATYDGLVDAVSARDAGDDEADPAAVFEDALSSRTVAAGGAIVAAVAAFARTEAGYQLARDRATKTWIVRSGNPRASHAAMDGETVQIDEAFSNGMNWPGDPAGGADEVAGCMCGVEVTVPD